VWWRVCRQRVQCVAYPARRTIPRENVYAPRRENACALLETQQGAPRVVCKRTRRPGEVQEQRGGRTGSVARQYAAALVLWRPSGARTVVRRALVSALKWRTERVISIRQPSVRSSRCAYKPEVPRVSPIMRWYAMRGNRPRIRTFSSAMNELRARRAYSARNSSAAFATPRHDVCQQVQRVRASAARCYHAFVYERR